MKIFVISDTHFNHEKMIEYCGRPFGFNDIIIKNWNKKVSADDLVIHLGDVILGRDSDLKGIMANLPGKKIICRGNHDHHNNQWYMDAGFDFVCDYYVYDNIAFSHAPLTPLPYQTIKQHSRDTVFINREVEFNIHGHFHNSNHRNNEKIKDRYYDYAYYAKNRDKYRLVQIEDTLRPFTLEEILWKNQSE